eukprot:TRINITY_DN10024_c0_g1_i1.p1 TRINITY_DN10024_c0_g1~~TRINITY_DN10024_c0_g1_i1.p1  ORF type:complete len:141 (+),score=14.95 TRINITY_DN10024_c0_g1_i1:1514-1936(+)
MKIRTHSPKSEEASLPKSIDSPLLISSFSFPSRSRSSSKQESIIVALLRASLSSTSLSLSCLHHSPPSCIPPGPRARFHSPICTKAEHRSRASFSSTSLLLSSPSLHRATILDLGLDFIPLFASKQNIDLSPFLGVISTS